MEAILGRVLPLLRRLLKTKFLSGIISLLSLLSRTIITIRYGPKQDHLPTTTASESHEVAEKPSLSTEIAASYLPSSAAALGPYLHAGPSSSRDVSTTTTAINQDSYSLRSLSVHTSPEITITIEDGATSRPPSSSSRYSDASAHSTASDSHTRASIDVAPQLLAAGDTAGPVSKWLNNKRIAPAAPDKFSRYSRQKHVSNNRTYFRVEPLTIDGRSKNPSQDWQLCLHPEGTPYFFHANNRTFTDANLFDQSVLAFINKQMSDIFDFLRAQSVLLDDGTDLVLDEEIYDDGTSGCQYYFVNHEARCIFWVDPVDSELFEESELLPNGIQSQSHIRYVLEEQYWYHCALFPHSLDPTHAIVDELRVLVLHSITDLITSATSTVNRKMDELNQMIKVINSLAKNVGKGEEDHAGISFIIGRLMLDFAHARVCNFYGEPEARLNVDDSVYDIQSHRTLLIKILTPILFYAPDFHLEGLRKIYTDGVVRHRGWSEFVTRLTSEWQEFILYATVVLNANVAFLSIQSVDTNDQVTLHRSPTQISSYMSMLTSIGAIIIGLLLLKQNRNRDRGTAPDASFYMFNQTHPTLGLEILAILHSLPYALLIWSMVSFLAAFSFMCFDASDLKTRSLVAVLFAAIASLILWCIFNDWQTSVIDWEWLFVLLQRRVDEGIASAAEAAARPSCVKRWRERWFWERSKMGNQSTV
ncbi:hypothetical protein MIND_00695300 [Mycena indigotica]|uniref:Uncharacterized protein n=1 Tax=Mycena indigotica TaxID=2126181 RepID=A0A8H6SKI8_9AGAR|nr:uncharacterized protein MIND_00695300 [Mycena indigotica]KAF7301303.1 hypothetical protein MIND_00695300 [Mycena indigotica]